VIFAVSTAVQQSEASCRAVPYVSGCRSKVEGKEGKGENDRGRK
jgi:hypothetical protein